MTAKEHESVAVIGAGGHAKVVISTLLESGCAVAAVFDDDPAKFGTQLLGVPVKGPIPRLADEDCRRAVIAIGDNSVREKLANEIEGVEWVTVVHPRAYVHPSARLKEGAVVFAGVIIQPDSSIGAHVIVNTGATIDHDCLISDYVHLAPGVRLAGGVEVGRGAFLGIGSVVIPNLHVGAWSVVGAGGVVTEDLPDNVTAIGVPARPIKRRL